MTLYHSRPFWPPGAEIAAQTFEAYEKWEREHSLALADMDILERVYLYAQENPAAISDGELTAEEKR